MEKLWYVYVIEHDTELNKTKVKAPPLEWGRVEAHDSEMWRVGESLWGNQSVCIQASSLIYSLWMELSGDP